jgi:hypothetical protein
MKTNFVPAPMRAIFPLYLSTAVANSACACVIASAHSLSISALDALRRRNSCPRAQRVQMEGRTDKRAVAHHPTTRESIQVIKVSAS